MSSQGVSVERPLEPMKRAIIVGGSSGIGAALARELASRGYTLAVLARREEQLAELCTSINSTSSDGVVARYYVHDVTDFQVVPALFQQIAVDLGGVDVVCYVAGAQAPMSPNEYDFEKDRQMIDVNLLGAMAWLSQAGLYFERARAGGIAGVSSIAADRGRRQNPAYNASKAGLDTYLEALRNRLSRYGVSVTTVKPGFVDTRLLKNAAKTMWVISPEQAARRLANAVERRRQTVYVPGRWRWVALVIRHLPSVIFRRLNI
jgi:decaprenylphospho-beta-D-erythro-pentofuranosid-2-ulose 2-reductase